MTPHEVARRCKLDHPWTPEQRDVLMKLAAIHLERMITAVETLIPCAEISADMMEIMDSEKLNPKAKPDIIRRAVSISRLFLRGDHSQSLH